MSPEKTFHATHVQPAVGTNVGIDKMYPLGHQISWIPPDPVFSQAQLQLEKFSEMQEK